VLFFHPFLTPDINSGLRFVIWPVWLLFSLGITLILTIVLTLSSPSRAHDTTSSESSTSSPYSTNTPLWTHLVKYAKEAIPSWRDRPKLLIFVGHIVSFALWCMYLAASEWQLHLAWDYMQDHSESNFGGFGQITALLLSFAPGWTLAAALYEYPSTRPQHHRDKPHTDDAIPARTARYDHQDEEERPLLRQRTQFSSESTAFSSDSHSRETSELDSDVQYEANESEMGHDWPGSTVSATGIEGTMKPDLSLSSHSAQASSLTLVASHDTGLSGRTIYDSP